MSAISNNKLTPAWMSLAERRTRRRRSKRSSGNLHRSNLTAYLMIAPMVVLLSIFVIYPLGYAFWLSGHRISFYKPAVWSGSTSTASCSPIRGSGIRCGLGSRTPP
jgi:hypothetical protein